MVVFPRKGLLLRRICIASCQKRFIVLAKLDVLWKLSVFTALDLVESAGRKEVDSSLVFVVVVDLVEVCKAVRRLLWLRAVKGEADSILVFCLWFR